MATYLDIPAPTIVASTTLAEGANLATGTATGSQIATSASQKLGFYGTTPIVQRTSASQAAVVTTPAALVSYGYTQSQADGIVTLLNEIRAALVAVGLIKGS